MFYSELVDRQISSADEGMHLGTLDLIVAYLTDKKLVEVTVVQAKNLPEASRNRKYIVQVFSLSSRFIYSLCHLQEFVIQ